MFVITLLFVSRNFGGFEMSISVLYGVISFGLGIFVALVILLLSSLPVNTKPGFVAGCDAPEIGLVDAAGAGLLLKIPVVAAKNIPRMDAARIAAMSMCFQGSGLADLLSFPPLLIFSRLHYHIYPISPPGVLYFSLFCSWRLSHNSKSQ